jgi:hypothetical protein
VHDSIDNSDWLVIEIGSYLFIRLEQDIGKYPPEQVLSAISISLYGQHTFHTCQANTYFMHDEGSEYLMENTGC